MNYKIVTKFKIVAASDHSGLYFIHEHRPCIKTNENEWEIVRSGKWPMAFLSIELAENYIYQKYTKHTLDNIVITKEEL